jgi:hypothetical protein
MTVTELLACSLGGARGHTLYSEMIVGPLKRCVHHACTYMVSNACFVLLAASESIDLYKLNIFR